MNYIHLEIMSNMNCLFGFVFIFIVVNSYPHSRGFFKLKLIHPSFYNTLIPPSRH